MTHAPGSADEALARIDSDIAGAQERARRATEFRQTLDEVRGRATVRGVTATLDSAGGLRDLALPSTFDERSATELRDDILAAVRAAQQDVADAVRREAARAFGSGSPVSQRLETELEQRFGSV